MKFFTAEQILTETPEPVPWIVRPWVAAGAITELVGKAKESGKTTLALAVCRCVLDGGPFLGQPTVKGPVVYLTEESQTTFKAAMRRAGIDPASDFHVLFWKDASLQTWKDVMSRAISYARTVDAKLLVVDTLARFANLTGDDENSAGHVLEVMKHLHQARDFEMAVLVNRHERKAGGSVSESGRGSSAFDGEVDIIMQLRRPAGNHSLTRRTISSLSRFDETPQEMNIELVDGEFILSGAGPRPTREDAKSKLLEILAAAAESAIELGRILEQVDISRQTAQRALDELIAEGQVARTGAGKKSDPYKYYRQEFGPNPKTIQ